MRIGFTFKGRHSDLYGAVVKTRSRPVRPEAKTVALETPATDGSYDFSDANPYSRYFYNDRIFEVELQVGAENLRELEKKTSKIAGWLMGRGELIFDDIPSVKWDAAALSEIGFTPALSGHKTALTAVFRVKPFSRCIFDTMNGIVLGTQCEIGAPVPISVKEYFTFAYSGTGSEFIVDNIGTWHARPVIRVKSSAAVYALNMDIDGKAMAVNDAGAKEIVIDCDRQTVTDGNGKNLIGYTTGDFFEMPTDRASLMTITNTAGDIVVTVEYEPRCVYDFDFMDWGVYDA